mgnify:FL=1
MTITQEVTVCTECNEVTWVLINPFIPPTCNCCGAEIDRDSGL